MWIEYRHKWSYRIDKKPRYIEIPDDLEKYGYTDPGDYIREETEVMSMNDHSDKYRGIQYDILPHPPISELVRKISSHIDHLEWHEKQLKRFRKMLDEQGYISKEDFNV